MLQDVGLRSVSTHGPEEMLGKLGCVKPLPVPWQLQLYARSQWGHRACASCLEGCGRLTGAGDVRRQSRRSLGPYGRKQEVRGPREGRTVRTSQLQGPRCLLLQKKSQKRRFREEPDDEEREAGTYPQYRGKSFACAWSGAPRGARTTYQSYWAALGQLEQRSLLMENGHPSLLSSTQELEAKTGTASPALVHSSIGNRKGEPRDPFSTHIPCFPAGGSGIHRQLDKEPAFGAEYRSKVRDLGGCRVWVGRCLGQDCCWPGGQEAPGVC